MPEQETLPAESVDWRKEFLDSINEGYQDFLAETKPNEEPLTETQLQDFHRWARGRAQEEARTYGPRIARLTYPEIVGIAESIERDREELHWLDSFPRFVISSDEYPVVRKFLLKRVLWNAWDRHRRLAQMRGEMKEAPAVPQLIPDPESNLTRQLRWLEDAEQLDRKHNPSRWDRFSNHEHPVWKTIRAFIRDNPGEATTDRLKKVAAKVKSKDPAEYIGSVKDYLAWLTDPHCLKNDTPVHAFNALDNTGYYISSEAYEIFRDCEDAYFEWLSRQDPRPRGYED